jgi:hypothetical protein
MDRGITEILEAIGIPDNCRDVTIRIPLNGAVVVTADYLVDVGRLKPEVVTKRFHLVETDLESFTDTQQTPAD